METTAAREVQINRSFSRLEEAIDGLNKTLSQYAQRLEPILSPAQPERSGETLKKPEALAPIAERLNRATDRVQGLVGAINSLSRRTEI